MRDKIDQLESATVAPVGLFDVAKADPSDIS